MRHSQHHYLIACCMQIRCGNACKIWSMKNFDALSCMSLQGLEARTFTRQQHCLSKCWISERSQGRRSIQFVVPKTSVESTRNRYCKGWAPPPVCLPSVYLTSSHVTRSARLSNTGSGNEAKCEIALPSV